MAIFLITTGGTIGALPYPDPVNPPEITTMPPDGTDPVFKALQQPPFDRFAIRYHRFEQRDSNQMDLSYRYRLLQLVMQAAEREILVTNGTDKALETAEVFYQSQRSEPAIKDKVILITGAMTPLANGAESDGFANLAFSLAQLDAGNKLTPGVYFVFCDYENQQINSGAWRPQLYRYQPDTFAKEKGDDGRRYRIRRLPEARAGLS